MLALGLAPNPVYAGDAADVDMLGIEELMSAKVTTVSRGEQRFADAAAAVFVISADDIRRSGATNIPEVLRMAPGVNVARIDASKWAVTIRGNNGRLANKLLVLVDGRSVYTPSFSGVYWETEDLLLEDIERIEVVRGPGASVWGANAVNGVVNIITKRAQETQAGLLSALSGDEERATVGLRWGGSIGDDLAYRVYAKYVERDGLADLHGDDAGDDWRLSRAGFRADWSAGGRDSLSIFGDVYTATLSQNYSVPSPMPPVGDFLPVQQSGDASGGSLMARWERSASLASRFTTQLYYQWFDRNDTFQDERRDTFDVDMQHELALPRTGDLVWGLAYRRSSDRFGTSLLTVMNPTRRDLDQGSAFVQLRAPLASERAELTLGTKLEYYSFAGWELLPTLRLLGRLSGDSRIWASVSRTTRTPSRGERDVTIAYSVLPAGTVLPEGLDLGPLALPPGFLASPELARTTPAPVLITLSGSPHFASEHLWSFELGGRTWAAERLSLDLAAFYYLYDDARLFVPAGPARLAQGYLLVPLVLTNWERGEAWGTELAADWRPLERLRLQLAYSWLDSSFQLRSGIDPTRAPLRPGSTGRSPGHHLSLRTSLDLARDLELDLWLRYVDATPTIVVATEPDFVTRADAYTTFDLRLAWRPLPSLELSLVGQNLANAPRTEFFQEIGTYPTQVERSLYGQIRWQF